MRTRPSFTQLFALAAAILTAAIALAFGQAAAPRPQTQAGTAWRFAASGDSRNCGDVVMPAIAAGARRDGAEFYWHLGDFRAIYNFDEDILHQSERVNQPPLSISDYVTLAWQDFIDSQLAAFGNLPVFLGAGNHETIPPKSRQEMLTQFADWFNSPTISRQRLADDPKDRRLKAYYHWVNRGVSFYTLDNSTEDQFNNAQLQWLETRLNADANNPAVRTVVVGMHEALPDSIASNHAMDDFPAGIESGRRVYRDLQRFQRQSRKRVYILASHSHYFMEGIFNTPYWRMHGGVLPGWIVGTAGAVRYGLPPHAEARAAQTNVYGYLLASVAANGEIRFEFKKLEESDLTAALGPLGNRYTPDFVHWCFAQNSVAQ